MDTLKVKTIKDTVVSMNNKVTQHTTVETVSYKGCKDCFSSFCDCKLLIELIWPVTVLLIIFLFRNKIKLLLDIIYERIQKGANITIGPKGISLYSPEAALNDKEIYIKLSKKVDSFKIEEFETRDYADIDPLRKSYIEQAKQYEKKLFDKLLNNFYKDFRVLSNKKIKDFQYDIILEAITSKEIDYIFEIKLYPIKFSLQSLQTTAIQLDQSTKNYYLQQSREVKPILAIILRKEQEASISIEDITKAINNQLPNQLRITPFILYYEEFDSLSGEQILKVMHND